MPSDATGDALTSSLGKRSYASLELSLIGEDSLDEISSSDDEPARAFKRAQSSPLSPAQSDSEREDAEIGAEALSGEQEEQQARRSTPATSPASKIRGRSSATVTDGEVRLRVLLRD